jgi:hypothetical protein
MPDGLVIELEVGSFSSGQVADPLGKDSKRNSWLREKQAGEGKGGFSARFSSKTGKCLLLTELPHFRPHQGIATDALMEKCSQDLIFWAWARAVSSSLLQFHKYTLESSEAETMCFPSEVKDADIRFPVLRRPRERKERKFRN